MTGSLGPDGNASIREAQAQFFTANDMPADGGYSATWWSCEFGPSQALSVQFPMGVGKRSRITTCITS